ncbi:MAG TPA: hypothetical protein VFQ58_07070 [Flavisolibacter sp.]|jgi:hypothetical protein|nr:hypothetical protein [Flavisolibacter sp.]
MKKTIFSLLIIGSSLAVCAQDVRNSDSSGNGTNSNRDGSLNRNNNSNNSNSYNNSNNNNSYGTNGMSNGMNNNSMNSNSSYNAYSNVPTNVRYSFQRDYPSANNVMWQQSSDWWHASYMNNGQAMNTYYNSAGQTFNVALPVMETQVPADVVTKISGMYGPSVYDITRVKGENNEDDYIVRILDNNGQIRTERINGEGGNVTEGTNTTTTTDNSTSTNTATDNSNTSMGNNATDSSNMSTNNTTTGNNNTSTSNNATDNSNTTTNNSTSTDATTTTGTNTTTTDSGTMSDKKQKDKMKIKTVTPDGKKNILKSKNGKVRTWTENNNNSNNQ